MDTVECLEQTNDCVAALQRTQLLSLLRVLKIAETPRRIVRLLLPPLLYPACIKTVLPVTYCTSASHLLVDTLVKFASHPAAGIYVRDDHAEVMVSAAVRLYSKG